MTKNQTVIELKSYLESIITKLTADLDSFTDK